MCHSSLTIHIPKSKLIFTFIVPPVIRWNTNTFYELQPGDNATLKCEARGQPSPNITWKREDGNVMSNGHFNYRVNNSF